MRILFKTNVSQKFHYVKLALLLAIFKLLFVMYLILSNSLIAFYFIDNQAVTHKR